jgi:elongation factor G
VPRIAFVNKMDRVGADFDRCLAMMRDRLAARPVPVQLPIGAEDGFVGVVDLIEQEALRWHEDGLGAEFERGPVPADLRPAVEAARDRLLEAAAESDDALTTAYLEGEAIAPDRIRKALREATLRLQLVPVLCGAAFKNKGIQPLLDAVVSYLPSPLDVPAVEGSDPRSGEPRTRKADDNAPFSALVFKLMSDKHVGHLSYLRVYSGSVETGQQVLNVRRDRKERVGRLLQMHANKRQEIPEAWAGDIVAVVGLKTVSTGDTLCDPRHPIALEPMEFPEPVISIAIEPKTQADMERLGESLDRLAQEDPSFRVSTDPETGQTLIAGMGELHLEIICDRLLREFKVDANVGPPQVAYKETLTRVVRAEGRYIKQTGGSGDFGVVTVEVGPNEPARALRSRTPPRARRSRASSCPPSARAARRRCRAASSPATRWSTCGCGCSTARRTTWTPRSAPSRSPARWR